MISLGITRFSDTDYLMMIFKEIIEDKERERLRSMPLEETLCPECGKPMKSRTGKYGVFWGCQDYPKCKGTRDSQGRSKEDREKEKAQIEDSEASTDNDKFRFRRE